MNAKNAGNHDHNCMTQLKCGICGESLRTGENEMWVAFIGGDSCYTHRQFIDPGMHPECAYYAAETCPYLKNEDGKYSKTPNTLPKVIKS